MNVLISSAGRRGALVRLFQDALKPSGGKVLAADCGLWSSACRIADQWVQVPRCDSVDFVPAMLEICRSESVAVVVPTIDTELAVLAKNKALFLSHGIHIVVSSHETVSICLDKRLTSEFFHEHKFPTVKQYSPDELANTKIAYPVIVKPRFGSASKEINIATSDLELDFYLQRVDDPIVQQLANGREFTVNFFVNDEGRCVGAVPHLRVETRGGEVSKCVTMKHAELEAIAAKLASKLPGAWGPMCYQAFIDDNNAVYLIEINARFGGGYPLAHQAGADFVRAVVNSIDPAAANSETFEWQNGVAMMRWDDAVFATAEDVGH